MRGNAHVRFGGRAGETERPKGCHRAPVRPYYLGVGTEVEHSCLLVVIGARADGRKELLAMELGYRESTNSWSDVLRDLRDRGLTAPMLAVGDGALGLWAALREVFPETARQRCWNHKARTSPTRCPSASSPSSATASGRSGTRQAGGSANSVATSSPNGSTAAARTRRPKRCSVARTT